MWSSFSLVAQPRLEYKDEARQNRSKEHHGFDLRDVGLTGVHLPFHDETRPLNRSCQIYVFARKGEKHSEDSGSFKASINGIAEFSLQNAVGENGEERPDNGVPLACCARGGDASLC